MMNCNNVLGLRDNVFAIVRAPMVLLAVAVLWSCSADKTESPVASEVIAVDLDNTAQDSLSKYFASVDFIPLELNRSIPIGEVNEVVFDKESIFVLDNAMTDALFCYDRSGKYRYHIQRKGRGPGEYLELHDFFIDGTDNTIKLLTDGPKVMTMDRDGNFINEVSSDLKVMPGQLARSPLGDLAIISNYHSAEREDFSVHLVDNNGDNAGTYLPFAIEKRQVSFSPRNQVSEINGQSQFFVPLDNRIYRLTEGGCEPVYQVDFGDRDNSNLTSLTPEQYPALIDASDISIIDNYAESQDYVFLNVMRRNIYYLVAYSKKSRHTKVLNIVDVRNDLYGLNAIYPFVGVYENKLVSIVPSEMLLTMREQGMRSSSGVMQRFIDQSTADDNPVLVLYELKPF